MSPAPLNERLMPVEMTVDELARAVGGKILCGAGKTFSGIGTDTRQDLQGRLFVPLSGANFDAHDFLLKAVEAGARVLLIHKNAGALNGVMGEIAVVEVSDTLSAFQALARYWRRKMKARVIGITGSNGKTTTKEFAAAILSESKATYWSQKSFNNHWGVPMSLLSIEPKHECALIEMGMNHPGELKDLCAIAEPDTVVVTMVGASHLEGVGSLEGVAKAKEEIYENAPAQARRIFNLDNPYTFAMYEKSKKIRPHAAVLTFSRTQAADVRLRVAEHGLDFLEVEGSIAGVAGRCRVPVFGAHNVVNLMAASAIALAAGCDAAAVWRAMPRCRNTWGRGQWMTSPQGAKILFDAYNANPESMGALVANLRTMKRTGGLFAVLGEMKELGAHSRAEHEKLGRAVAALNCDGVWFVGNYGGDFQKGIQSAGFSNALIISDKYQESEANEFASRFGPGDIVVVKGSRGVALERVLQAWGIDLKH